MNLILQRLRSRRLASTFVLLATVSAAVIIGSFAAHGVRGQERQTSSNDATPLKVITTATPPNDFVRIAKEVGPAVVNINTETLPKQSTITGPPLPSVPPAAQPAEPDDDGDQTGQRSGPRTTSRTSSTASSAARFPTTDDGDDGGRCANRSAPASSSIPRATSSPTTTSSTRPTRSTSSSPPILTRRTWAVPPASSASTRPPTSPSSRSTPTLRCPRSRWATPRRRRSATGSRPSAARSRSRRPSPPASSPPRTAPSSPAPPASSSTSSRPTPPSIPATPAARCSNMNGEVIGVNTAIYTQSAGYQGIGFAMPSNTVVAVYNDLISPSHKVIRGSIGIQFQPGSVQRRQSRLRLQDRRPRAASSARRPRRQGRPQAGRHHHHHRWPLRSRTATIW